MEIKSILLNDSDFKYVKESILNVSKSDEDTAFKVRTIEYINDSSTDEDDMFFFEMLEFVRFLNPSDDAIAYTTPDHLIYMNCSCTLLKQLLTIVIFRSLISDRKSLVFRQYHVHCLERLLLIRYHKA